MAETDSYFFKVIILGDSYVGKTSLMHRYVNRIFESCTKSTVGVDLVVKKILIDETWSTLQIWDTAGLERFNSLCSSFFRGADCCVFVYDVTVPESFQNLDYWYNQFLAHVAPRDYENFPFTLIGNKVDLPDRKISAIDADEWCYSKNQCQYYETSALNGTNVDVAFQKIAKMAINRETQRFRCYHETISPKKQPTFSIFNIC